MYNGIQGKVIDMGQRTEKVFSRNMKFGKKKMREVKRNIRLRSFGPPWLRGLKVATGWGRKVLETISPSSQILPGTCLKGTLGSTY